MDDVFRYFNSIKVRLELGRLRYNINTVTEFQFHKGTIRTEFCLLYENNDNNFNSIKVRLELRLSSLLSSKASIFQFHKGTIRTSEVHL